MTENSIKIEVEDKPVEPKINSQDVDKEFIDVLKLFSPGTIIRTALNDLLRARMGALIVVDNGNLGSIVDGGFRIGARISSQKIVELCKMDGAIVLSKDMKKILYANALLVTNSKIPTKETGTRHKAGERTAKQAQTTVVAVSERKNKISLYYKDVSYQIAESSEILRRAVETLQMMEKQRDLFDELLDNLNILELKRLVTINDVSLVLQRLEILKRVSVIVKRYLAELGKEGMIVSMSLKEATKNLERDEKMILKDYFGSRDVSSAKILSKMDFDFLLETSNISRMLFDELHDRAISPRGYRILSKIDLLDKDIKELIKKFKKLNKILTANDQELLEVLGNEGLITFFKEEIFNLKEKLNVGKRI